MECPKNKDHETQVLYRRVYDSSTKKQKWKVVSGAWCKTCKTVVSMNGGNGKDLGFMPHWRKFVIDHEMSCDSRFIHDDHGMSCTSCGTIHDGDGIQSGKFLHAIGKCVCECKKCSMW